MTNTANDEEAEYDFLVTRAKFHQRTLESDADDSPQLQRKKSFSGKFVSCSSHHSAADKTCSDCVVFPMQDSLPNGRLPTGKQVLAYLFYLNYMEGGPQKYVGNTAADVMNHWIACNVYTKTQKTVKTDIQKLLNTYNDLKKVSKAKKEGKFKDNLAQFSKQCNSLFDIKCTDAERLKRQEQLWNVKETDVERQFYAGQCKVPQVSVMFAYAVFSVPCLILNISFLGKDLCICLEGLIVFFELYMLFM